MTTKLEHKALKAMQQHPQSSSADLYHICKNIVNVFGEMAIKNAEEPFFSELVELEVDGYYNN